MTTPAEPTPHHLAIVGDPDCDEILNWLDTHSVSLTKGLPLHTLLQKWRKAGRSEYKLGSSLKRLFEADLVVLAPGVEPPHLRITVTGYARLIAAPEPSTVTPESVVVQAPSEREEVPLFVSHGRPLTEIGLRNQVLAIYRELQLQAEGRLIAVTLSRYWQEMGLRVGDLRTGLDVLLRDGYLRQRLDGIDVFWVLTADGEAYLNRPLVSPLLLGLSPAVTTVSRRPGDPELQQFALHAFSEEGFEPASVLSYPAFQAHWRSTGFDEHALLHALDWLTKLGWVQILPGETPAFRLTPLGAEYARSRLAMPLSVAAKLSRTLR